MNVIQKSPKIYHLKKKIGGGDFSEIFLTIKLGSKEYFVTKITNSDNPQMINEINILKHLNHQNIVNFEYCWHENKFNYLVMEYMNGNTISKCLNKYMNKNNRPFSEKIVQYIMKNIVNAVQYLHNNNIIHRDLKLDNIMAKFRNKTDLENLNMFNAEIKIIDFDLSKKLEPNQMTYTAVGTGPNMAPNLLKKFLKKGNEAIGYGKEADIWSLGTICYQMIIGKEVFDWESLDNLLDQVEKGKYQVPTDLSAEIVSFLNGMLQYDGKKRLTINQLVKHPFLTKNFESFTKLNLRKFGNNNQLNINIKKNRTIWSIFNQEDENKLISISGFYNNSNDLPIKEDEGLQKINSAPINNQNIYHSMIPLNNNYNLNNQKLNRPRTLNENQFYNRKSFYGQDMSPKAPIKNGNQIANPQQNYINDKINNNPVYNYARMNSLPPSNSQNIQNNFNLNSNLSKSQTFNQNNYYNPLNNDDQDNNSGLCMIF